MSLLMIFFLMVLAPLLALALACLGVTTSSTNVMGWFLLFMGVAYFAGGPMYVWKENKKPAARREERGDLSFWFVQPGFILAILGAPLEYLYLPGLFPRQAAMPAAGLLLVGAGVVLLAWARRAIRGQFSGHVQIQAQHRLVQTGPYRCVRHPGYLGYLLLSLGVAVGYSSLLACAAVFLLLVPGLIYRMRVEERLLIEEFGDAYRQYAARTRRLVPGIW